MMWIRGLFCSSGEISSSSLGTESGANFVALREGRLVSTKDSPLGPNAKPHFSGSAWVKLPLAAGLRSVRLAADQTSSGPKGLMAASAEINRGMTRIICPFRSLF
eukprot:Skav219434  [mRNA]  locus=scaffold1461:65905:68854:- [translate_table: standard]